jgi:aminoglycoside/choline kinase family phosphotransferase
LLVPASIMTERAGLPEEALAAMRGWLGDGWTVVPLAGDASTRAYYRVTLGDGTTNVLAWYPEDVRSVLKRFLDAYEAVSPHAYVPRVLEHGSGLALQQDVGDHTLFELLHQDLAEGVKWYRKAVTLLYYFQRAGGTAINPPFTSDFFLGELEMTREFYVEKLMAAGPERSEALKPLLKKLANNIARHPYVLCHRDYHGQNIHIFNEKLYLIDYQDMRMGPDTYDLASLLRDRGVARILGEPAELELVDYYAEWRAVGVPGRSPFPHGERRSIRRRYFETLLQRSIKILGTFSKMPITRGKLHYLDFIPPTIESVQRCLRELPDYALLGELLPMQFNLAEARSRVERMSTHG